MRGNIERTAGVSASIMAALMLAVFTVSARFGVMLPLLDVLDRAGQAATSVDQVQRNMTVAIQRSAG